jgi:hypothetical protein
MIGGAVFVSLAVCGVVAIGAVFVSFLAVRQSAARNERTDAVMGELVKHLSNCLVMPEGDQIYRVRAETDKDPAINAAPPATEPLNTGREIDRQWDVPEDMPARESHLD